MDLKETEAFGEGIENHWYYISKFNAMLRLLSAASPSVILDIGAGSGFFSKKLLSNTTAKKAWCLDIGYEYDSDATEAEKTIYFRRSIDTVNADLVLLVDVLEHVVDDINFLRGYVNKVPSRARFIISVPAFQCLWSSHDVFLEHKRRYRLNHRQASLTVTCGAYYFGAVFPIALATRLASNFLLRRRDKAQSQLSQNHPLTNGILAAMSSAELPFFLHNRLAGLTAFILAEKP